MKNRKSISFVLCFLFALIISSCGSAKTNGVSVRKQADLAFETGDYLGALTQYQKIDSLSRDSESYRRMTISALKIEEYRIAYKYGKQFDGVDTMIVSGFKLMTDAFVRHQREVQIVEEDKTFFYELLGKDYLLKQLADYYIYCGSDKIIDIYFDIADAKYRNEVFPFYFMQAKKLKSEEELKSICLDVLKENKDQLHALKYLGVNKYNYAEDEYKKAMEEYNKKKNSTTYAYLLRDLKIISKEYVKSKEYLERVHKLDPEDQVAIKCLVNIYNRLDQPAKAKALQKLLK